MSISEYQHISGEDISHKLPYPHPPPGLPLEGGGILLPDALIADIAAADTLNPDRLSLFVSFAVIRGIRFYSMDRRYY